jgi:hypothetical protein
MLELFCRVPEGIHLASGAHLTPIPFDDAVASLSAILLENEYYTFIIDGRRMVEGLPWIGAEQLIPLKARLIGYQRTPGRRRDGGFKRSAQACERCDPAGAIICSGHADPARPKIAGDFGRFLVDLTADRSYHPRELPTDLPLDAVIARLRQAYGLSRG